MTDKQIIDKVLEFKNMLLDKDCPLGIDEILKQIEFLFEDDKEISKVIDGYIEDYCTMFLYAQKFYKVKELVDEEFYNEVDDEET